MDSSAFERICADREREADVLARAKDTAVNALKAAGIVTAGGGKVRLLKRADLPDDWDPAADRRLTVWEATQHLIQLGFQRILHLGGPRQQTTMVDRARGYSDEMGGRSSEILRDRMFRAWLARSPAHECALLELYDAYWTLQDMDPTTLRTSSFD